MAWPHAGPVSAACKALFVHPSPRGSGDTCSGTARRQVMPAVSSMGPTMETHSRPCRRFGTLCDGETGIGRALLARLRMAKVVPFAASPSGQSSRIDEAPMDLTIHSSALASERQARTPERAAEHEHAHRPFTAARTYVLAIARTFEFFRSSRPHPCHVECRLVEAA